MLRCAELGLSEEALREMTIGMVYDMIIEQVNDQESTLTRRHRTI